MAESEVLQRVSLAGLSETLPQRLASIWQTGHQRTQILILIQRHHRERFEKHASSLELQHPTWSLFYRPRKEAGEMAEIGFDSKKASFLFLDIALADLGRFVGPLSKDDWEKEEIVLSPSENSDDFGATKWTLFRDPWLSSVEVLPLASPPDELVGNAWLTTPGVSPSAPPAAQPATAAPPATPATGAPLPATSAAAQPGSEPNFEGMLAGVTHSFPPTADTSAAPLPDSLSGQTAPAPAPTPATPPEPVFEMPSGPISIPSFNSPSTDDEEPAPTQEETPALGPVSVPTPEQKPDAVPSSFGEDDPFAAMRTEQASGTDGGGEGTTDTPSGDDAESEEEGGESSESTSPEETIREEFVDTIELLLVGGLSAEQVMESPAFQEVSERATAAGLDTWNIFLAYASDT
jgi:hypothetical protein